MKKSTMLLPLVLLAAGAAQAGAYEMVQENDCKLVSRGELAQVIDKVGKDTGLALPRDMALRAELHCAPDGKSKRYVYSIRATVEKLVQDGEQQRWAPVAYHTGYGTARGTASLLKEVRFALRDVIRQEP